MAEPILASRIRSLKPNEQFLVNGLDWSWAFVSFSPIPDVAGYLATSDGRILSCWEKRRTRHGRGTTAVMTDRWHEIGGTISQGGYRRVVLCKCGKKLFRTIHNVILTAFYGAAPPGHVGCHNNGDPAINDLWNLRWDTQAGNIADKFLHGTMLCGESHGCALLTEEKAVGIREKYATGTITQRKLAAEHGVHFATISEIVLGHSWKCVKGPIYEKRECASAEDLSSPVSDRIVFVLREGPIRVSDLVLRVNASRDAIESALTRFMANGIVERIGRGVYRLKG